MTNRTREPRELTDYERWRDVSATWGERNPIRAQTIASIIPGGESVLDIGAGSMILGRFLEPGCHYQPCDIYPRSPDCIVADLNRGEFPAGRYDWVVMAGLLQYLPDPQWALQAALAVAPRGVFTYTPALPSPTPAELEWRRGLGWVNHMQVKTFVNLVVESGWRIIRVHKIRLNIILECHTDE